MSPSPEVVDLARALHTRITANPEARSHELSVNQQHGRATRVGRNSVWRVVVAGQLEPLFLNLFEADDEYARQIEGHRLAGQLAGAAPDEFIAVPVIHADASRRLLVLGEMRGVQVSDLVRRAYRRDRWLRRDRIEAAAADAGIDAVVRWLSEFQAAEPVDWDLVYDHRPPAVRSRVKAKIELLGRDLRGMQPVADLVGRLEVPPPGPEASTLIFGDVSLSNFFVDGTRVGAIDFEDIGRGVADRDRLVLCLGLDQIRRRWTYAAGPWPDMTWSDEVGADVRVLLELEMRLLELEQAIHTARDAGRRDKRRLDQWLERVGRTPGD